MLSPTRRAIGTGVSRAMRRLWAWVQPCELCGRRTLGNKNHTAIAGVQMQSAELPEGPYVCRKCFLVLHQLIED